MHCRSAYFYADLHSFMQICTVVCRSAVQICIKVCRSAVQIWCRSAPDLHTMSADLVQICTRSAQLVLNMCLCFASYLYILYVVYLKSCAHPNVFVQIHTTPPTCYVPSQCHSKCHLNVNHSQNALTVSIDLEVHSQCQSI